jgi:hypothetical protein
MRGGGGWGRGGGGEIKRGSAEGERKGEEEDLGRGGVGGSILVRRVRFSLLTSRFIPW